MESTLHPVTWRCILILSSNLRLVFQVVFFTRVQSPGPRTHLSCRPHVPHAPPISWNCIWSPEMYLLRRTDNETPRYVLFSTPTPCYLVLLKPIMFPAPYFRKSSTNFSPLVTETDFRTHFTFQSKPDWNVAPQYTNSTTTTNGRIAMNLLVIRKFSVWKTHKCL
jgi:hypothetical protein